MGSPTFPATVVAVHDGDTLTVLADLGFDLTRAAHVRLWGINAIELDQPGGPEARPEARDHLIGLAPPGAAVTLISHGWDNYGDRVDGEIITAAQVNLATRMISDGYAAAWDGRGPRPIPPWPNPTRGGSDGADPPPAPTPG
jgi:endonuclease YncB( thermonuclease family)